MPQLQLADATLHYEDSGTGSPLLLIAGTASDSASWGPLPPLLGTRRLIMPDNRGSGRTLSSGTITSPLLVDDLVALLDHLELGEVDVCGHSLGGHLALSLALRQPDRIRRVVTLGAGTVEPHTARLFADLALIYPQVEPQLYFRLLYQWLFSPEFFADPANVAAAATASTDYPFRQTPEDFARQVELLGSRGDFDPSAIRCPVLAITGERDLLAPPAAMVALHRGIFDLTRRLLPHAAHATHWEAPDEVARLINQFLG